MDVSEIVRRQREFFDSGATRPAEFRLDALESLRRALREREGELSAAMLRDLNKQPFETYMCETGLVLDECRYHIRHLRSWMKEKRVPTPLAQFRSRSFVSPEPYGVVFIATPWNYPIQLCLDPLIGAISGGNCAVIKPSAQAPETSHALARLIREAFPPEYVTVAECSRAEADALLEEKWDYIFFTGSPDVGRRVMAAAAKNLTPVSLELGGKSPVIVDATADLKLAARRVAFGKVLNAGQTCVEPDYLLVEAGARDAFLAAYRAALREFFPDGDMSRMVTIVNEKHYQRLIALMAGQTAAIGGGTDAARRFVEPTVFVDVAPDSPLMQNEIFGPVLPVLTWTKLDEAIDFVRGRPRPLALYLFTRSAAVKRRVLDSCSFGGGCINDTIIHLATPHMGFGGVGSSGMGQYHGKKSFDTFTHCRSIVDKACWLDLPLRYFPYTAAKEKLLRVFLR